ncbi:MAG: prepilin-type N-terminal cleavage/methylation domain-containing protein [Phormidesmis sp.]
MTTIAILTALLPRLDLVRRSLLLRYLIYISETAGYKQKMPRVTFKTWRHRLLLSLKQSRNKGFTLLELLVAVVISGMVVSGLLYLVVELLRIDNRETALEEVQRDTQRAMNYIADELRQAVYVYSTPTTVAGSTTTTGVGSALPTGSIPILAFWKVSPISQDDMPGVCSTTFSSDPVKEDACDTLKIRRASYDLVVYSQIPGATEPWEGQSRISRYVLKQYKNIATLEETDGYINPGLQVSSFEGWQRDITETLPTGGSAVLVDYVDKIVTSGTPVNCDALAGSPGYLPSPPTAVEDTSFFACIRDTNSTVQQDLQFARSNQDIYLFLRGDASARSSSVSPASDISRSPMLQTQVLIRGVINKNPTD